MKRRLIGLMVTLTTVAAVVAPIASAGGKYP